MNKLFFKVSILVAGSVILNACGDKKADAPNPALMPVPVNLYEVHPEHATYSDQYPGTVVALEQVDIRSQTEGYVTGIFFKEGDRVKKGEKLYEIDRSKYQASYGQSQSAVQVAQANLEQAQKDADRYAYLNEHDAVAKQTLDHAMTTLQNAKNQLAAAKQDMSKTQTDLNYAVIRAPFDGTIGISQVKQGASVIPGQTILNTISSDGPVAVDFVINEKQIPRFTLLQQKKPTAADSIFSLLLPDNSKYDQTGEIYFMDRGVNTQTGTLTVRVKFPNPASMLKPGMSCKISVRNQSDTGVQVLIPGKAIVEQMGEYFVYLAKDTAIISPKDTAANKATPVPHAIQKKVTLGPAIADRVIVKAGLHEGDEVIVDGVQKLHDGSLIKKPANK